ncbi:hypothetical protein AGMMS4952_01220 [Spirochaetia bacterium]|nr:hypothetical protein AGMMS4952_01220 [Spirochaetia bacterium]
MHHINSFTEIKLLTENLWDRKKPDKMYGYQFQQKTKWKKGLSDDEIAAFENSMLIDHPENPILTMHGKDIQYYSKSLVDMFYQELAQRGEKRKNKGMGCGWIEN